MKKAFKVVKVILIICLLLCMITFGIIQIASSTILSESYILKQLEEANYYDNIHTQIKSDFENYIYQSGLEENVLENIVSIEEIKEDTQIIISNIYNGDNKKIDVTKLKEKLSNNIKESLKNKKISATEQKSIDEFVNKITNQYIESMSHTNFEKSINEIYQKVKKYVDFGKKVIVILIGILVITILVIQYKNIFRNFAQVGIALTASGLFFLFVNVFINTKIRIANIVIFNESISITLRNILTNILNDISNYGWYFLGIGILLIIVGNIFNNIKRK